MRARRGPIESPAPSGIISPDTPDSSARSLTPCDLNNDRQPRFITVNPVNLVNPEKTRYC